VISLNSPGAARAPSSRSRCRWLDRTTIGLDYRCMKALLAAITVALTASPALAAERFPLLTPETMTAEQKAVMDNAPPARRGRITGPYNAWLRSPEFAALAAPMGDYIRFKSSLSPRLTEFAILITARYWTAQFEWYAHYPLAMQAGLDPRIAAELADGKRPEGMQEDEAAVYDFMTELRETRQVSDATYARTQKILGDKGVIDLVATSGYYELVSMTLNIDDTALPPGGVLPLKPLPK